MNNSDSSFPWAQKLKCPQTILTGKVQNILSKGTSGYIWDHMSTVIYPTKEVDEIKKNILLYALKSGKSTSLIQSIHNLRKLRVERLNLEKQIETLENNISQKEFVNRQSVQNHRKKTETRNLLKIKKNILNAKYEEKQLDIENHIKIQEIYTNLKPPSDDDIEPWMIEKCLSLVSTLASGAEKKEVWQQINNIVRSMRIQALWNFLLQKRAAINDQVFQVISEKKSALNQITEKTRDYNIAALRNKHISIECNNQKYKIKFGKYQNEVFQLIEMIEVMHDEQNAELREWLPLKLEIKNMEVIQMNLQNEIRDLKNEIILMTESNQDYVELTKLGDSLKNEVKYNIQNLGKSLQILKSSQSFIIETRNSLNSALQNLQSLHLNYEWLNSDLKTELLLFHDSFDINATRKISLKGDINSYRHLSTCINEAVTSLVVQANQSKYNTFPMIKAPAYHLLDCFKEFVIKEQLQEEINLLNKKLYQSDFMHIDFNNDILNAAECNNSQIMELLTEADLTCNKTYENIQDTYSVIDNWVNQSVEKTILTTLNDIKVNQATLKEWKHRYKMLIYMIKQSL